jgi:glucose-6-phosphate 1-dehydrogenase
MEQDARHPFLDGLSKHRGSPPTIVVIFGASGDLTARKLVPAVYNLAVDNLLPASFHLIGFGRKEMPDEEFRASQEEAVSKHSRRPCDESVWVGLRKHFHYVQGSYDTGADFDALRERIESIEKEEGKSFHTVFYISTPPNVFAEIVRGLGESGLAERHVDGVLASRCIIEKPFGRDLQSAHDLNQIINRHFREEQVFRIDHYLGKETVQNLLVQRFANSIFEPVWNREYIAHVQLTVAENLGVGSRAGYYDQSGALRDMIQNHTMQLLALTAMEPPVSLDPEAIRDEKVKVIKAIQPLCFTDCYCGGNCDVVRARYTEGLVEGETVPGYLQEDGVPETSHTETFTAMRLMINNWRWQGVPFYLRSGKRLARRVSEIAIQFKRPPGVLFHGDQRLDLSPNTLAIQVQPDEGVALVMNSKIPGLQTRTQPVKLHFRYKTTFGSNTPEAYERLILDALVGDSTLFIRGDETEGSWRLMTPILERWDADGNKGMGEYPAGSWGPKSAEKLIGKDGFTWRRP